MKCRISIINQAERGMANHPVHQTLDSPLLKYSRSYTMFNTATGHCLQKWCHPNPKMLIRLRPCNNNDNNSDGDDDDNDDIYLHLTFVKSAHTNVRCVAWYTYNGIKNISRPLNKRLTHEVIDAFDDLILLHSLVGMGWRKSRVITKPTTVHARNVPSKTYTTCWSGGTMVVELPITEEQSPEPHDRVSFPCEV